MSEAATIERNPIPLHEPCGEECSCAGLVDADDWLEGVECYRRTALLNGE